MQEIQENLVKSVLVYEYKYWKVWLNTIVDSSPVLYLYDERSEDKIESTFNYYIFHHDLFQQRIRKLVEIFRGSEPRTMHEWRDPIETKGIERTDFCDLVSVFDRSVIIEDLVSATNFTSCIRIKLEKMKKMGKLENKIKINKISHENFEMYLYSHMQRDKFEMCLDSLTFEALSKLSELSEIITEE